MTEPMEVEETTTLSKKSTTSKLDEQLPWVEKYRPQKLEDLVAHTSIINILTNLIDNHNLPHLLFYGPPGTGKTSTIIAAAKRMYNNDNKLYSSMTLELNASDSRGIDVVRNEIKEFAATKQLCFAGPSAGQGNNIKLIILDEADAMTSDAQFALRRIIEKYTKNVRFCFICNYVSKIIPALQSRCTKFRFAPLHKNQIDSRLREIIKMEPQCQSPITIEESAINAILSLSNGDMRRVLNLLQATIMSNSNNNKESTIDENAVYLTSGSPLPSDIDKVLYVLFNDNFTNAYTTIVNMCTTKGYALTDIVTELCLKLTTLDTKVQGVLLPQLYDGLSDIEYRLSFGTNEKLQIASLVGIFVKAREEIQIKGKERQ